MDTAGLELVREEHIPLLQATALHLRHLTGAELLHFACADPNLHVSIAVPTRQDDDRGGPHALEHSLFGRSKRVGSPKPGSRVWLLDGGGAWTGPDYTHYGLSARDEGALLEALDRRLDQLLEPCLDPEYVEHQVHRTEFEVPDDPSTPLVHRGVLYNEQKGVATVALLRSWQALLCAAFDGTDYAHMMGGSPEAIPGLSRDALAGIQARFYHRSALRIVSWGDLDLSRLCAVLDEALGRVPDRRYEPPAARPAYRSRVHRAPLPVADSSERGIVLLGWVTTPWTEPRDVFCHEVVTNLLLDGPSAPLRRALLESGLGTAIADVLTTYGWRYERLLLATGLTGVDPATAEQVPHVAHQALANLVARGIAPEDVAAVCDQLEYRRRSLVSHEDPNPIGSVVLPIIIPSWVNGGDPLRLLDLDGDIAWLRTEQQAGRRPIESFISRYLLDPSGPAVAILEPDPETAQREDAAERAALTQLNAELTPAERDAIVERSRRLQTYLADRRAETAGVNPDLAALSTASGTPRADRTETVGGIVTEAFIAQTRGLVMVDLYAELSELDDDLVDDLPLLGELIRQQVQQSSSPVTAAAAAGGAVSFDAVSLVRADGLAWSPRMRLSTTALRRSHHGIIAGISDALAAGADPAAVRQAIDALTSRMEQQVFPDAAGHAARLAAARLRSSSRFTERLSGLHQLLHLRGLHRADALDDVIARLERIRLHLTQRSGWETCAAIPDEPAVAEVRDSLTVLAGVVTGAAGQAARWQPDTEMPDEPGVDSRAWGLGGAWNAMAVRLPGAADERSVVSAVALLCALVDHVAPQITGKGNSYGVHPVLARDRGVAGLVSVRDSTVRTSLTALEQALRRTADNAVSDDVLTQAKLVAWQNAEPPEFPEATVRRSWLAGRAGRTAEDLDVERKRLVGVDAEEVQHAADAMADHVRLATLAPVAMLDQAVDEGVPLLRLELV